MLASALGLVVALPSAVRGHGSMIMPPSRNSIDATLPAWSGGKHPTTGLIEPYTCSCSNGTEPCDNGQSCFWFSQGVSVGCSKADGNGTRFPNLDHCQDERPQGFDPLKMDGALDPKYRTTNIDSPPGTHQDIWKYNPWRAPGKGPLADPCGMAGGNTVEVFNAGAYNQTPFAKQGDLGTKVLKPRPMGVTWTRGAVERARWESTAAHGGGYIYQLCPAESHGGALTEECFASRPLAFAKPYTQRAITHDTSKDYDVNATVVESGGGQGWMINPFPYGNTGASGPCDWYPALVGQHCEWPCARCGAPWYAADGACPDANCKHDQGGPGLPNTTDYSAAIRGRISGTNTIEDKVVVPTDIPAGEYVLRWRWDCEASSQVWTTCSDITIV